MDFKLHSTITLRPRSFNVLVAPREMLIQALNLQRSKVLCVAGNSCSILSRLDRRRMVASLEACFMLWATRPAVSMARSKSKGL